jgi:glutaconate CoA-transferase subunit A
MTPDLIYDQMIGMGCASRLIFSWGGNPGVGFLHRFRDAIQTGWPAPLAIEEHSHADMAARYQARASGLPFAVTRGYVGSDLPKHNSKIKSIECPFTGEILTATPVLRPDVSILHAQKADRKGNVLLYGIIGIQKEAARGRNCGRTGSAAERLRAAVVGGVLRVRGAGRRASFGYYKRDNAFCIAWDGFSGSVKLFARGWNGMWWAQRILPKIAAAAGRKRS